MNFLTDRSPREQALIAIAGGLIFFFLVWQFLVSPILKMGPSAEQTRAMAINDYQIVAKGLPSTQTNATRKLPFSRNTLIQEAQAVGIKISRVQPQGQGAIKVWFEDVVATDIFTFLSDMTGRYNTSITNAQVNRRDGGTISAQFTLSLTE